MSTLAALQRSATQDAHLSQESEELGRPLRLLLEAGWEMGVPTAITETSSTPGSDALARRFEQLAKTWREECAHFSSVREMVLHPAYQQIVGMGRDGLPFLLRELERQPDHWFWALWAITQENPVPVEHRGRVPDMARDWLEWARQRGIRW